MQAVAKYCTCYQPAMIHMKYFITFGYIQEILYLMVSEKAA